MAAPANRVPVRVARGTFANITSGLANIQEGELVYAKDQDALYVKEGGVLVAATGAGGATVLDQLTDVDTSTSAPADGEGLIYNSTSGKWEPGAAGGANAVNDLTDVNAPTPTNGQVLAYNSGTGNWEPTSGGGGSLNDLSDVNAGSPFDKQALVWNNSTGRWINSYRELGDNADVSSTAPATGEALVWSGSEWAPGGVAIDSSTETVSVGYNEDPDYYLFGSSDVYASDLDMTNAGFTQMGGLDTTISGSYPIDSNGTSGALDSGNPNVFGIPSLNTIGTKFTIQPSLAALAVSASGATVTFPGSLTPGDPTTFASTAGADLHVQIFTEGITQRIIRGGYILAFGAFGTTWDIIRLDFDMLNDGTVTVPVEVWFGETGGVFVYYGNVTGGTLTHPAKAALFTSPGNTPIAVGPADARAQFPGMSNTAAYGIEYFPATGAALGDLGNVDGDTTPELGQGLGFVDGKYVPSFATADNNAPASANAAGRPGQIAFANGFIYVCVARNTWQRASLSTF